MVKSVVLCIFLTALPYELCSQESQSKPSNLAATTLAGLPCAKFLSNGNLLTAKAVGADLQVEIKTQSKALAPLHFTLDEPEIEGGLVAGGIGWPSCTVSADTTNHLAAVGIPVLVSKAGKVTRETFLAVINLDAHEWGPHRLVGDSNKTVMFPQLIGFLDDSDKLLVVTDLLFYDGPARFDSEIIDAATGNIESARAVEMGQFGPIWKFFFDARNNCVWVESGHEKSRRHTLQAVSLSDVQRLGPNVDLTKLKHDHWLADWGRVNAMAFPSPNMIIFADTGASMGFEPSHLWVMDLSNGSVRIVDLPKDTGEVLLHGLGFSWFEDVDSPAVLSPDGRFVAVPITLTKTGPPYIVDNYISAGVRFVIVDLMRLRILSSVTLKDSRAPLSFALDHRDGKVTLLVNTSDAWKSQEFAAPE